MEKTVIIAGAGLGGLSAAIYLAKMGYSVRVYEKNACPGGKVSTIQAEQFYFDTGPSLITMPFVIDDLFRFSGVERKDYLELEPIDPLCRYFYRDGSVFDAHANLQQLLHSIGELAPEDKNSFVKFYDYSKRIYELTANLFLFSPIHEAEVVWQKRNLPLLLQINRLDAFRTVHNAVRSFFKDSRLVQLFDRYCTYNGSNPFQAPATLNIIPYVEYGLGGFYIRGGIYKLVNALVKRALELGVELHYNSPVQKIVYHNNGVTGVQVNDQFITCSYVVSNVDAVTTFNELVDGHERKKQKLNALEPSLSGLVFLWGINGSFPMLMQHNIIFSDDYYQEFKSIFTDKQAPDDPTIYIAITCKKDPSHAPSACENWFVLVNMPYLTTEQDWPEIIQKMKYRIIQRLLEMGIAVEDKIIYEKIITPVDFYHQYKSNKGSIYGISSNTRQMAFKRPENRNREIPGLFFAGGSAHPGGGVPLVLLSGKIAAELINKCAKGKNDK